MKNFNKQKEIDYIECERCNKNNWDDPEFWGCPRGFCEAETRGIIVKKLKIKKLSFQIHKEKIMNQKENSN